MRVLQAIRLLPGACLLAIGLAGCGTAPDPDRTPEAIAGTVRAAARRDGAVATLNAVAHARRGSAAELAEVLRDPDPAVRRAAAYVAALWADDASDVAALTPLLSDGDAAVRAIVAGSLAGLGDVAAKAALTSLRDSADVMPWSDPVLTVGTFARSASAAVDGAERRR
jgi:HEAT repeat protein